MEVKTESGGTFDAAGKGSTALGIVGTVLGGLGVAGNMGGLLGRGLFNNGYNWGGWNGDYGNYGRCFDGNNGYGKSRCFENDSVTEKEFSQEKRFASLFADFKSLEAERYTDKAVIAQAEKESIKDSKLAKDLLDIGIGVTKLDQQMIAERDKRALRDQILELKIRNVEDKVKDSECRLASAIALESERRSCGDSGIYNFVKGTYVPGKLIMPMSSICPPVMPRYNSWTAPETAAGTTPAENPVA